MRFRPCWLFSSVRAAVERSSGPGRWDCSGRVGPDPDRTPPGPRTGMSLIFHLSVFYFLSSSFMSICTLYTLNSPALFWPGCFESCSVWKLNSVIRRLLKDTVTVCLVCLVSVGTGKLSRTEQDRPGTRYRAPELSLQAPGASQL